MREFLSLRRSIPRASASIQPGLPKPAFVLLSVALVLLPGCAARRMRSDFIGFEKAYAETSNREVLLNLARLQNHDTTYFFKLGQISSSYRMQASLSGTGNYVIQGTGQGGNATGGGTPGLTYENDPAFTFIPVNDETSAQLLLKPVPAQTLYNLYLQGWRVDQLFRLMVDRIELTTPNADGKSCSVKTIRNVPPPKPAGADSDDKAYLREASSYATFLRVSALVYGLQKHGYLKLRGTSTFVAFDAKSGLPAAAAGAPDANAPKATDFATAASKNESWRLEGNQWVLGQQVNGAEFYLTNPPPAVAAVARSDRYKALKDEVLSDDSMQGLQEGEGPDQVLDILSSGFSIEEAPGAGGTADNGCGSGHANGTSAHLVLRSLIGLMAAAAQEESAFDALKANTHLLPASTSADKLLTFAQAVPPIEQVPSLRLTWSPEDKAGPGLVEVSYRGKEYMIADSGSTLVAANQYWNRDMFRLVNQLTAQVTVDISKFPLPGILQLHSD
jgi:hypothetical protein